MDKFIHIKEVTSYFDTSGDPKEGSVSYNDVKVYDFSNSIETTELTELFTFANGLRIQNITNTDTKALISKTYSMVEDTSTVVFKILEEPSKVLTFDEKYIVDFTNQKFKTSTTNFADHTLTKTSLMGLDIFKVSI